MMGQAFAMVPVSVITDTELGHAALRVYLVLRSYDNGTGVCWPSMTTIGKALGMDRTTVLRHLNELKTRGHISIDPNRGHSHHFLLNRDPCSDYTGQEPEPVQPLHTPCVTTAQVVCSGCTPPVQPLHTELDQVTRPMNQTSEPETETGASAPPAPAEQSAPRELFEHYRKRVQPQARLFPQKRIESRLKSFSAAEIVEAINNFAADEWQKQHNHTRGAPWFFASDERIEHHLHTQPNQERTNGLQQRALRPGENTAEIAELSRFG